MASIIITFTLAILAQQLGTKTVANGLALGLAAGIGFVATTQASSYTFESKAMRLYFINIGYPVVAFAIIGVILAAMEVMGLLAR